MTIRDDVWSAILETLAEIGEFHISDLSFEEADRHTVRRVLVEMERMDWLKRNI